ncbi:hypothetical protein TNCV_4895351 [Trichonephila clavipes]|nr:hypothetical protein TNCV_4895351 [Trichonephila clavipes]
MIRFLWAKNVSSPAMGRQDVDKLCHSSDQADKMSKAARCQAKLLRVMKRYSQQLLENCVELLSKEMPDIKLDDNCLFEKN